MRNRQEKGKKIKSNWWRWPLEALFPDKKFDGQLQNPGSEEVFDFDDAIAKYDIFTLIAEKIAYYPPKDRRELFAIFIPGLGQPEYESSRRSCRYAETLKTGIVNLNNSSYLKKNPIVDILNPYLDWIDAAIHRLGLSGSPVINNTAILIVRALDTNTPLHLSADSHGTILLARAINRAKRKFIDRNAAIWNLKKRHIWELKWQEYSHKLIRVFNFGNGYQNWIKGPKYIMVSITGDPLPEKFGITPEQAARKGRDDIKFLIFSRLFPEGSFEAHNMMFTTELLRQTFLKNGLEVGDFASLYFQLHQNSLKIATPEEVSWPQDMKDYVWNPDSLKSIPNYFDNSQLN
ncbi:MAG: hypothetical protein QNJ51_15095 [Calothrix sp. MO_167.B12]|nr:hypothetical protein [Calothrix sp. MO_167.B12]